MEILLAGFPLLGMLLLPMSRAIDSRKILEKLVRAERFQAFNLKADIFGGMTTAVVSLPMALAFGVASGAGAQAGLYGAAIVGLFAALFGGSRVLISEPTGPMTVVMTAVIMTLIASHPEDGLAMAFAVVFVAGLTQIALGLARLGRYITLMPYSVISGFMSGIGALLILLQIYPILGLPVPQGGALNALAGLPAAFGEVRWGELLLAASALLILFGMPASWRRKCPPHLVALAVGTVISLTLFASVDLRRVGEIPMGLPEFRFPHFTTAQMSIIVIEGMILGLLGCIDTLLTAMIADSLTRKQHDSNRELIGQGIANMATSCFGGLPGAGATMGTVVNIQVGARSPAAAILRALILVLVVLALAPLLESVPMAVLAAIAFKVGYDILDWSFLKRAHVVSRSAALIMYGVMALTVFVDLIAAVGIGVFIANVLTIERLTRLQSAKIKLIDTSGMDFPLPEAEKQLFDRGRGKILLLHLSGPMIFGVANAISQQNRAMDEARALILDLSDVPLMSTTVALALENVVRDARKAGLDVFVCTGSSEIRDRLQRLEDKHQQRLSFAESRLEAIAQAVATIESQPHGAPSHAATQQDRP